MLPPALPPPLPQAVNAGGQRLAESREQPVPEGVTALAQAWAERVDNDCMDAISSTAVSGMRVAVMGVRVSAHNIAVQAVQPVVPREVLVVQTVKGGGASAQVTTGSEAPNMVADLMEAKTYELAFAANAVVIRRHNDMLGKLFDAFA